MGQSGARMGLGESKKSKSILASPRGVGLKSRPITFVRQGKFVRGEVGKDGLSGAGQNYHP